MKEILLTEEVGLALPQRPEMAILKKSKGRKQKAVAGLVILANISISLAVGFFGAAVARYQLSPYEIERRSAVDIQVEIHRLCDKLFTDAAAAGRLRFTRLGREDSIARASGRCTQISDAVMAMVSEAKVKKRKGGGR